MFRFRVEYFGFACLVIALAVGGPARAQITQSALEVADPFTIALTPAKAPLTPQAWAETDRDWALTLLQDIPREPAALSASSLIARVVLSGFDNPGGGEGEARAFSLARVEAVYQSGRVEEAVRIASAASGALTDAVFAETAVLARFLDDDRVGACDLAAAANVAPTQGFWARVRAACLAMEGERAAAELTLGLAREGGAERADAAFEDWIAAAAGEDPANALVAPRDAVELAMALSVGDTLDTEAAGTVTPPAAAAMAKAGAIEPAARALAAQRMARAGALRPADLAAIYTSLVSEQGTEAALAAALKDPDAPLAAAHIHRAVTAAADDAARAKALSAALQTAQTGRDFLITASLYSDALGALPASEATVDYAPVFAEAAAVAGDVAAARKWLELRAAPSGPAALVDVDEEARAAVQPDPIAPLEVAALTALITAADPDADGAALAAAAGDLIAAAVDAASAERARGDAVALILLALGADTDGALRAAAARAVRDAPALSERGQAALAAMVWAADAGAAPELALSAARVLHEGGGADPRAAAMAIRTLWRAGFDAEARLAAVETLLAARRG